MKKAKNRDRILDSSIDLFNQSGVVAVTTNHIADHLNISPGNLYFHFRNKEEIIRELFERMCKDVYSVWAPNNKLGTYASPLELIEKSLEVSVLPSRDVPLAAQRSPSGPQVESTH